MIVLVKEEGGPHAEVLHVNTCVNSWVQQPCERGAFIVK